ncbi:IS607 family transposase [bacterium]|nr:IS607 family transposase [bacterium]
MWPRPCNTGGRLKPFDRARPWRFAQTIAPCTAPCRHFPTLTSSHALSYLRILQEVFGYDAFRGPQEAIIEEKESICYCRVSSHGQKEDLERQVSYMQERFPGYRIIRDIGSGINFKRRGLRTILELACKGYVSEVVVAYRDRLCRFAFELVEWLLSLHGVKLVVLNEDLEGSESGELAEDLLSIVHVFNCRIQGRRKYQGRKDAKGQGKDKHQEGGQ